MIRIKSNNLYHYQFSNLAEHASLAHAVFTRHGGVSTEPYQTMNIGITVGDPHENVHENIRRMSGVLGSYDAPIHTTRQVHGADVTIVSDDDRQAEPPDADGIVTNVRGVQLLMRFADCVPIILYDPFQHAIGMAHAGWRGTVAKVAAKTVETMSREYGSQPEKILAGIGPSIGPEDYEVGEEVAEQVRETFDGKADILLSYPNGKHRNPYLDLWKANEVALREAGVLHIETAAISTARNTGDFYSYRVEPSPTGRFGVMAMLKEPQDSDD